MQELISQKNKRIFCLSMHKKLVKIERGACADCKGSAGKVPSASRSFVTNASAALAEVASIAIKPCL